MAKRIILAVVTALLLTGCGAVGDRVAYEVLTPEQVRTRVHIDKLPGSAGAAEVGGNTYAFLTAGAREDIEVLSVEKADVGIDILYRIKASESSAPETKVVKIRNLLSVPVGFKQVD